MKFTIFAKKRQTREGKPFISYITRVKRKDGTEVVASVRFRAECDQPKADECPMNIEVPAKGANINSRTFTDETTGEVGTGWTIWVNQWAPGEVYEDHSFDEFDV